MTTRALSLRGWRPDRTQRRGFTLIELLIVVTIIAILAMIALVQFNNAQVRAKIARTVGDFKALQMSLNIFYLDNEALPISTVRHPIDGQGDASVRYTLRRLTTPITYISALPYQDPFNPTVDPFGQLTPEERQRRRDLGMLNHYQYFPDGLLGWHEAASEEVYWGSLLEGPNWEIISVGPAQVWPQGFNLGMRYNPARGLKSEGILWVTNDSIYEVGGADDN